MQAAAVRCLGTSLPQRAACRPRRQVLAVNAQLGAGAAAGTSGSSDGPAAFGGSLAGIAGSVPSSSSISKEDPCWLCAATGGGDGGSGAAGGGSGAGGGAGGGGGDGSEEENEEYLNLQQAEEMAAAKGVALPEDFAAAAGSGGLRLSVLESYCKLATGGFVTSWLVRAVPAFRDRLIADRLFFFKVWAEVAIDSGCATVAEVRKRGDEFWSEFEFYLSDLLVGLVLDVVLVTLIAPVALPGRRAKGAAQTGLRYYLSQLPSAVFQKSTAGRKFGVADRAAAFVRIGLEYSLAGITCGFVGQGIANSLMLLKRHLHGAKEDDVAVPPLVRTALVWGMFMGLSSNTRYQIVFGLERVVDETIARSIPSIAYFTTLAIRFANNVVGGENFIDMARWAGVQ